MLLAQKNNNYSKTDDTKIRKIISFAKTSRPKLSEEAVFMMAKYWSDNDSEIVSSKRALEATMRISFAFAPLRFSDSVTPEIAKEALGYMQRMYDKVQKLVVFLKTPIDAAIEEIDKFMEEGKEFGEYDFLGIVNAIILRNTYVEAYFGGKVDSQDKKYRNLMERYKQRIIGNSSKIAVTNMNPFRIKYIEESNRQTTPQKP